MPLFDEPAAPTAASSTPYGPVPPTSTQPTTQALSAAFPPVTRDQILHCSYDQWYPRYRDVTVRSRIVPLSAEAVAYLREDGIILADEEGGTGGRKAAADGEEDEDDWAPSADWAERPGRPADMPAESDSEDESESVDGGASSRRTRDLTPPNQRFPALHAEIVSALASLPGGVGAAPKLNWSSPQDATWIGQHQNSMRCTSPNDVYLLLKSSSFVSHDLELAFEGCVPPPVAEPAAAKALEQEPQSEQPALTAALGFRPVLVLRQWLPTMHPSLEFRCFVRHRVLAAISQRDSATHYPFLLPLSGMIVQRISAFFDATLRDSFDDGNFVFDVYFAPPQEEQDDDFDSGAVDSEERRRERRRDRSVLGDVRLVDINPWAPRTDALLFAWDELLALEVPGPRLGVVEGVNSKSRAVPALSSGEETDTTATEDEDDDDDFETELRLVDRDNPAACNFASCRFSAHKLPKDVVDAGMDGEDGMREFLVRWKRFIEGKGGI